jgi:hypothetical protein
LTWPGLAIFYEASGKRAEAEQTFGEAMRQLQGLADTHPEIALYQSELAKLHTVLGMVYHKTLRPKEAEKEYLAAQLTWKRLKETRPEVLVYHEKLADRMGRYNQRFGSKNKTTSNCCIIK